MNLTEAIAADTEMFRELFNQMDADGCFDDRMPNDGLPYSDGEEYADLVRYASSLEQAGSLSFWEANKVGK